MQHPNVHPTRHGEIALIRLDRPPVNALDLGTLQALVEAVEAVLASDARALVLTGREGSFSAGLDLKAVAEYDLERQQAMAGGIHRLCAAVYGAPIPTVAAISGHAIGGGLVLALACDQRLGAARPSIYSLPEARAGIPFPPGAMAVVRSELGPVTARRLALGDQRLDPEEALAAGLLDRIVQPESLLEVALETATRLSSIPSRAFVDTKRRLRAEALALLERSQVMDEAWL